MPGWLELGVPWWELALRAVVIYLVFFVGLRIFGKREIGQFTVFDLVLVLLVANALQPAMTGPDTSLTRPDPDRDPASHQPSAGPGPPPLPGVRQPDQSGADRH